MAVNILKIFFVSVIGDSILKFSGRMGRPWMPITIRIHKKNYAYPIRSGSTTIVNRLYLDPVSVVNINVDVENPGVILEQLQYGHHYVVDIAESACLKLLQRT